MSWYNTYTALVNGRGPQGTVRDCLRRTVRPDLSLTEAIRRVREQADAGALRLTPNIRRRVTYWEKKLMAKAVASMVADAPAAADPAARALLRSTVECIVEMGAYKTLQQLHPVLVGHIIGQLCAGRAPAEVFAAVEQSQGMTPLILGLVGCAMDEAVAEARERNSERERAEGERYDELEQKYEF